MGRPWGANGGPMGPHAVTAGDMRSLDRANIQPMLMGGCGLPLSGDPQGPQGIRVGLQGAKWGSRPRAPQRFKMSANALRAKPRDYTQDTREALRLHENRFPSNWHQLPLKAALQHTVPLRSCPHRLPNPPAPRSLRPQTPTFGPRPHGNGFCMRRPQLFVDRHAFCVRRLKKHDFWTCQPRGTSRFFLFFDLVIYST